MRPKTLWLLISGSIKNTLLFRGSFFSSLLSIIASEIAGFICLLILLTRFQGFGEYTTGQFAFIYINAHVCYGITMLLFHNLRTLGKLIMNGSLDRFFLLPVDTMLYICAFNIDLRNVAYVIVSGFLFWFFRNTFQITWNVYSILLLIMGWMIGICVLSAILIIISTLSYKTVDWKAVDNMFNAFKEILWYPVPIFNHVVQFLLYTFIPLSYISYVPSVYILDPFHQNMSGVGHMAFYLAVTIALLIGSYQFWNRQTQNYQSTS